MAPSLSCKKPPPTGTGAPSLVPMPKIETRCPCENVFLIAARSRSWISSVMARILPLMMPAWENNLAASARAAVKLLPWAGIMSVSSDGIRLAMVALSSVNGVTTNASAA